MGFLIVLGLVALIGGPYLIWYRIRAPFARKTPAKNLTLPQNQSLTALLELQTKDTDKDGLTDYDELYVYQTSPYLEDTDSDGLKDKTEVDQKKNPLCPEGQECLVKEAAPGETLALPGDSGVRQNDTGAGGLDFSSLFGGGQTTGGNLSAAQLRQLLEQTGMAKETLDKIDDKTLLDLYNKTIGELGQTAPSGSTGNLLFGADLTKLLNPENLSATEIRELLRLGGVDEKTLQGLDDASLKKLFEEALKQAKE